MRIRLARPEDRPLLLGVWERSVRATHGFLTDHDIVSLRPLVARELEGDSVEWWVVASADDLPIGFLGYAPGTVEALFLDPDHRRRGVGTLLVDHARQLAGEPLSVEVNEQNEAARRFYEALGFVVIARSDTDSAGRPFPLLHMRQSARTTATEPRVG